MSDPKPTIERVEVTYTQDEDTSGRPNESYQSITLVMMRMDDGDDGHYVVIQTDRWAVNDAAEMSALVDDFNKRCKNP